MGHATLLAVVYLAFISLGLPDSVLGVAWPAMRADFGRPVEAAGLVTLIITACSAACGFASGRLLQRFGTGGVLTISGLLTGLALLGFALAYVIAGDFNFKPESSQYKIVTTGELEHAESAEKLHAEDVALAERSASLRFRAGSAVELEDRIDRRVVAIHWPTAGRARAAAFIRPHLTVFRVDVDAGRRAPLAAGGQRAPVPGHGRRRIRHAHARDGVARRRHRGDQGRRGRGRCRRRAGLAAPGEQRGGAGAEGGKRNSCR